MTEAPCYSIPDHAANILGQGEHTAIPCGAPGGFLAAFELIRLATRDRQKTVNFPCIEAKADASNLASRIDSVRLEQKPRCVAGYKGVQVDHRTVLPEESPAEIIRSIAGLADYLLSVIDSDGDAGKVGVPGDCSKICHLTLAPEKCVGSRVVGQTRHSH